MRVTALILVYYFSFLSMLPFVSLMKTFFSETTIEYCGISCCEDEKSDTDHKDKLYGLCNPFQSCFGCNVCYFKEFSFEPLNKIELKRAPLSTTTNDLVATYHSKYFHPPDIV